VKAAVIVETAAIETERFVLQLGRPVWKCKRPERLAKVEAEALVADEDDHTAQSFASRKLVAARAVAAVAVPGNSAVAVAVAAACVGVAAPPRRRRGTRRR